MEGGRISVCFSFQKGNFEYENYSRCFPSLKLVGEMDNLRVSGNYCFQGLLLKIVYLFDRKNFQSVTVSGFYTFRVLVVNKGRSMTFTCQAQLNVQVLVLWRDTFRADSYEGADYVYHVGDCGNKEDSKFGGKY